VRRRKVLHFLNQGYHFREAPAGDKTQLLANRTLTPASNIRVRYRDEDGDTINLWEDSSGFSFGVLRSAKEVKERDFKKIFLQATELDSTLLPVK